MLKSTSSCIAKYLFHTIASLVLCLATAGAGMAAEFTPPADNTTTKQTTGVPATSQAAVATPQTAGLKETTISATSVKNNAIPVFIELTGTDTIGAKLSMQLQEMYNTSSLFALTPADVPKIRILITTKPEFASRPAVGSAYSVVWLYYEKATTFNTYLASDVGVVTAEDVASLAMRLMETTAELAAKYSYIFPKK